MINEIKIMTVRESGATDAKIINPAALRAFWQTEVTKSAWYDPQKEAVVVFALDSRNHLTSYNLVTLGLLSSSLIHPREVFRPAIIAGAAACVLAHNHPGNDATPSAEDIRVTRQLVEAGKIIDLRLMDHVVIAETGFVSMRESGLVNFC